MSQKTLYGITDAFDYNPRGFQIIPAFSAVTTGRWYKITSIGTTQISASTCAYGSTSLSGQTLVAGQEVFGNFTTLHINTGAVIAYKLQ